MTNAAALFEVVLDKRRRTSLARIGRKQDLRYIAEAFEDGTIVLSPARTVTEVELAALSDPEIRAALRRAGQASPKELRSRGSFAEHADR